MMKRVLRLKNKRKTERVTCLVPVEGKKGSAFDLTQTIDISKQGIGFISQNKIPLNKKITIELDLHEEDAPVFVTGKVKWVHPIENEKAYRIGLSFVDVKHGSKSRLNKYFSK